MLLGSLLACGGESGTAYSSMLASPLYGGFIRFLSC
jgi:hypothetical protein